MFGVSVSESTHSRLLRKMLTRRSR
jgi:hypothetical protein